MVRLWVYVNEELRNMTTHLLPKGGVFKYNITSGVVTNISPVSGSEFKPSLH